MERLGLDFRTIVKPLTIREQWTISTGSMSFSRKPTRKLKTFMDPRADNFRNEYLRLVIAEAGDPCKTSKETILTKGFRWTAHTPSRSKTPARLRGNRGTILFGLLTGYN